MFPLLNWRELELLVRAMAPALEGLFVEKILVPERPRFPAGYVKGEWGIRLTGRRDETVLLFGVRPRHCYLALAPGRGPRAASTATHSPFDMVLSKQLKGRRVVGLEALSRERIAVLWLAPTQGEGRTGLVLSLIPSVPEALLIEDRGAEGWKIIARSRTLDRPPEYFVMPSAGRAPEAPAVHEEWLARQGAAYKEAVEDALEAEAFELRRQAATKALRSALTQAGERRRQSEVALAQARSEEDWQKLGDLLKNAMGSLTERQPDGSWLVPDYSSGGETVVPGDPKLSLQEQVEKYFQFARRKARRASEAHQRIERFSEVEKEFAALLESPPAPGDWAALEAFERKAGISIGPAPGKPAKERSGWLGKSFRSRDGLTILVGRSRDENLELTFKVARGNDLWMHVRGRPGAHVLIPLSPGKSAPLETLLDAAVLTVYYSGGEKWGKTEVDYSFKKYVKRIRDSTEASYTHNKTLIVEPDPVRLKRLLESAS